MSPREAQVIRFIAKYTEEFGHSPYHDQIAAHLKANSRGFICRLLDNLERKGLIERQYGARRSIVLRGAA